MTNVPLKILPGIYTEGSARGVKNRWKDGDHIRFRNERPQKIGGRIFEQGGVFDGICRTMKFFASLLSYQYIMLGTHTKLEVWDSGTMVNVTPLKDSTSAPFSSPTLNNPFSTSIGSSTVDVADTASAQVVGNTVTFSNVTNPTGGLNLNGTFTVNSVTDDDNYSFDAGANATSNVSGGGGAAVDYDYEIDVGAVDSFFGLGWGAGGWNEGTWDTPRSSSGIIVHARTWSIDNWGEDIIANIRGGATYAWDTSAGANTSNRATLISGAPDTAEFIVVSASDRILIAFGAHDGSNSDPMFIRWSDSEDYTDFIPSLLNLAGDKRLDKGTIIITAVFARKQILILTDLAAYSMYAVGYPDVYGFSDALAEHCGAISPGCAISSPSEDIYWMGLNNFFILEGGTVNVLPCDVRNYVFGTPSSPNINMLQRDKITCGINSANNEIWWNYCSATSNENDRYVAYNYNSKSWHYGSWGITAWMDMSGAFGNPIACHADSKMYNHEIGYDDDTQPLEAYIESYDLEVNEGLIGEADNFGFIRKVIPDFEVLNGSVNILLKSKRYPQDPNYRVKGPNTITSTTMKRNMRMRGRQLAIRIESVHAGDYWLMNEWRLDLLTAGKRG